MQITVHAERYTDRDTRAHHSPARPSTCRLEKASRPCTVITNGIFSSRLISDAACPQGKAEWAWITCTGREPCRRRTSGSSLAKRKAPALDKPTPPGREKKRIHRAGTSKSLTVAPPR